MRTRREQLGTRPYTNRLAPRNSVHQPISAKDPVHLPISAEDPVYPPVSAQNPIHLPVSAIDPGKHPVSAENSIDLPVSAKDPVHLPVSAEDAVLLGEECNEDNGTESADHHNQTDDDCLGAFSARITADLSQRSCCMVLSNETTSSQRSQ